MHDVGGEDVLAQRIGQRSEQRAGAANPLREQRAIELHTLARVDLRLPIERQMIRIFADQHVRQQSRSGDTALDRARQGVPARSYRNECRRVWVRTKRSTLKRTGSSSSISEMSSARCLSEPPQSGHDCWGGATICVSRARCSGNSRRTLAVRITPESASFSYGAGDERIGGLQFFDP